MTSTQEYEGWTNRETWLANLHLSNERDLYDKALRTAATGIDRDWAMRHVGEMLVGDIKHEMQRLLGRGQTAMYFDFCPEDSDPVIPSINRVELAQHWVAEVVDHREHGEIIKPRQMS